MLRCFYVEFKKAILALFRRLLYTGEMGRDGHKSLQMEIEYAY